MGCTVGEIDFATRRALNLFDKWNNVTGFVPKFTSYYYEIQSCIKDAVLCGVQVGVGVHELLPEEIEAPQDTEDETRHIHQQLKPKMPSFADITRDVQFMTVDEGNKAFIVYSNIARHFGH